MKFYKNILKLSFIFLFIFSLKQNHYLCHSQESNVSHKNYRGLVMTLEGSLFLRPDFNSEVVERIRQGSLVFIHPLHFESDADLNNEINGEEKNYPEIKLFYKTIERNGREAYIPKKQIKLIYGDGRELQEPILESSNDPTNYNTKKAHALLDGITEKNKVRGILTLGTTFGEPSPFPYSKPITNFDYGMPLQMDFSYLFLSSLPTHRSLYFGGMLSIYHAENSFTLAGNNIHTTESRWKVGLGPNLLLNFYQTPALTISLYTSPIINFLDRNNISIVGPTSTEKSQFTAIDFSLRSGFFIVFNNVMDNLNLVIHGLAQFTPERKVNQDKTSDSTNWSQPSSYTFQSQFIEGISIGIESSI
jgi:hypothetical protein